MPPSRRYPPGLQELSERHRALIDLFGIDSDLVAAAASFSDPMSVERRPGASDRVDACRAAGWLSEPDGLGRTTLGRYRGTAGTTPKRRTICRIVHRRTATFACLGRRPLCESAADAGGPRA